MSIYAISESARTLIKSIIFKLSKLWYVGIENKCHKDKILSNSLKIPITYYTCYRNSRRIDFRIGIKGGQSCAYRITSQENFRETSNFPLYRVRESAPAESSRPEVATRWCGNKFKICRTLYVRWIRVPWCETGSDESGSKDSKVPQESLSFFRLNKKREKSRLRMCQLFHQYWKYWERITSFREWYSRYGWWSPRGVEEEEDVARDLRRIRISRLRRIYDRPIFSFSRTADSRLRFSRIRIHGRRIREAPTISRGKYFAIKRVEVLPKGYAHGVQYISFVK